MEKLRLLPEAVRVLEEQFVSYVRNLKEDKKED